MQKRKEACRYQNCDLYNRHTRRFCKLHAKRMCTVEGCDLKATLTSGEDQLCKRHGGVGRCAIEGCLRSIRSGTRGRVRTMECFSRCADDCKLHFEYYCYYHHMKCNQKTCEVKIVTEDGKRRYCGRPSYTPIFKRDDLHAGEERTEFDAYKCDLHGGPKNPLLCIKDGCEKHIVYGKSRGKPYCRDHGGGVGQVSCYVPYCDRPTILKRGTRSYCSLHNMKVTECEMPGCKRPKRAGKDGSLRFCLYHGGGRFCIYTGCKKQCAPGMNEELCERHSKFTKEFCQYEDEITYERCRNHRAPGMLSFCALHGGGKQMCQHENCDKYRLYGGPPFCLAHGGGKRCSMENCKNIAVNVSRSETLLCKIHGGLKLCEVEGCESFQIYGGKQRCLVHGGGRRCERVGCETLLEVKEPTNRFCEKHGGLKKCQVKNCTKQVFMRGKKFCVAHIKGQNCQFEGCTNLRAIHGVRTFCKSHGGGYRCQMEGCTKARAATGGKPYCITHGGGKRCSVEGCDHSAATMGLKHLCIQHGGGRRCQQEGCDLAVKYGRKDFCRLHLVETHS